MPAALPISIVNQIAKNKTPATRPAAIRAHAASPSPRDLFGATGTGPRMGIDARQAGIDVWLRSGNNPLDIDGENSLRRPG